MHQIFLQVETVGKKASIGKIETLEILFLLIDEIGKLSISHFRD